MYQIKSNQVISLCSLITKLLVINAICLSIFYSVFGFSQEIVAGNDETGRRTILSTRLTGAVDLDGQLNEAIYQSIAPVSGLTQNIPDSGEPASERTEVWIFYDDDNIYIGVKNYDSAPPSEWIANEMRRDVTQLRSNDSFSIMFDTFLDRRNGFAFLVTPLGGFSDFAIANERNVNTDWNVVWDSRTGRFDGGWTIEMQIPFRSLRFQPGDEQAWGVQFRRIIRRRNEASYFTSLPISAARGDSLIAGLWRISEAATLTDLDVPTSNLNFQIKPYGLGSVVTDRLAVPPVENEANGDFGVDMKFSITNNLTADFTYNTDFAQVEADEQQVNLTRFGLSFPEKREFFLEGRGNFEFTRAGDAPTMFFSRRIGLERGEVVPILAGARLTGKVGDTEIGVLNIATDPEGFSTVESNNFSAIRVKRDVLNRSNIGAIFTNKSNSNVGDGANRLYGIDGRFAFLGDYLAQAYIAKTDTPGLKGEDVSYMGNISYNGDLYGFSSGALVVEDNFNPEIGFLRRDNFKQYSGSVRFSPRPESIDWIRRLNFNANTKYFWSADKKNLETRTHQAQFVTEFENSDQLSFRISDSYEYLAQPFQISSGIILQSGSYNFTSFETSYRFGQQRPVSGQLSLRTGDFWSGTNTALRFTSGRIEVSPQISIEPSYTINLVKLPEGDFDTKLGSVRLTYTFSPRMYLGGLVQYNSTADSFSTNFRFRWEWSPGSELFIVYSDDRDTDPFNPRNSTELRNRGFLIKFTKLFQI